MMMIRNPIKICIAMLAATICPHWSSAFLSTTTTTTKRPLSVPSLTLAGRVAGVSQSRLRTPVPTRNLPFIDSFASRSTSTLTRMAVVQDLSIVALVAGQENYGLAVVCLGEAVWSLLQAPSVSYAARLLIPAGVASIILAFVSGPMIQSGSAESVGLGLGIATLVSVALGASYVLRLTAPYSPSPKEIAALGFLLSVAGFVSFMQNLLVDGFVSLPSIELPSLPSIELF